MNTNQPTKNKIADTIYIRFTNLSYTDIKNYELTNLDFREQLHLFFENVLLIKAIKNSAPDFYNTLLVIKNENTKLKKRKEKKIILTLYKYLLRMSTRPIPNSLFAGLNYSKLNIGDKNKIEISNKKYLIGRKEIKLELKKKLFTNNTLHQLGSFYFYVYTKEENQKKSKVWNKLEKNNAINKILKYCEKGIIADELLEKIILLGVEKNSANDIISNLFQNQILVNNVTHETNIKTNIKRERLDVNKFNLDSKNLNLFAKTDKVFFTNFTINSIEKAVRVFLQLSTPLKELNIHKRLTTFGQAVYKKHSEEYVPILEIFNPINGIGYNEEISFENLDSPIISKEENRFDYKKDEWTTLNIFWLKKYEKAIRSHETIIQITEADLKDRVEQKITLPTTCLANITISDDKSTVWIKGLGGSNAMNLIGRFSLDDPNIETHCKSLAKEEEDCLSQKKITPVEIDYCDKNENKILLNRCKFYTHTLLVLNNGSENDLQLKDIFIKIRNNFMPTLWHKKLGEITPRNSSAFNPKSQNLSLYQFLSDAQIIYNNPAMGIQIGNWANEISFFPRIAYKNIVLRKAIWHLFEEDLRIIKNYYKENNFEAIREFMNKKEIPNSFCIITDDKEILITINNDISIEVFISELKEKSKCELTEYIYSDLNKSIVSCENKEIAHEILFFIHPDKQILKKEKNYNKIVENKGTIYLPGSEWIYTKWYMNEVNMDNFLGGNILPLINKLKKENLIAHWFFVRYNENGSHIRLRIKLNNLKNFETVNQSIKDLAHKLLKNKILISLEKATYTPEYSKFGGDKNLSLCYAIFELESEYIVKELVSNNTTLHKYYIAYSLVNILKNDFEYERKAFESIKNKESRSLKDQLLEYNNELKNNNIEIFFAKYDQLLSKLITKNEANLKKHLFHLFCNRLFNHDAKAHEKILHEIIS